jgi:hypothetical protein
VTIDTKMAREASDVADTAPYCSVCGHWATLFAQDDGWQHSRRNPAPNGTQAPFGAGQVDPAWCVPPARSVSPAQCEQLLAALDDAIAYREHAAAPGYASAYLVLRRQLAAAFGGPGAGPA